MNSKTAKLLKQYSAKAGVKYGWLKNEYKKLNAKERGDFIREIMWVTYQLDKLKESDEN